MGKEFRRLHPETIRRVLYRLRGEIIREGQDGLEHVNALLRLRGADPEAQRVPEKQLKGFGRGKLRLAIMRALQDGPRTGAQIAAAVAAGRGWTTKQARANVYPALCRMRDAGSITAAQEGGGRIFWSLLPQRLPPPAR